ncbi:tetratricopeptide repeat protein [Fulvivirgaceae bacterium BMA12]|uniref:Tetratricopeptide repeat protein n=1 Tax=Agaribacillus aureus TaxID=3051825 RepID=A0ABT8LBP1_9BACT|nr:tetratricopeptide repeat protein [Fulvivirgaceae bacterium BMA12]
MKKLVLYGIIILVANNLCAQSLVDKLYDTQVIDSLEQELSGMEGSERLGMLNVLAEAYWFHNPDMTLRYAGEALTLSQDLNDEKAEGYALINICQGYLLKDIYDKALEYGLKSLEIRERLESKEDIAYTLRTLGWLYYDIEDSELALAYHEKVLNINLEMNDPERIAYSYNSLGLVYAQKNDHERAINYFLQSLQMKEQLKKSDRISESLKNIGISYSALEQYGIAMDYLLKASKIFNETHDYYRLAQVYNELALVYLNLNQLEVAGKTLKEGGPIIDRLSDNQELKMKYHLVSSRYHDKMGDHARALEDYRAYMEIYNKTLSREQNHKLAQMRVTYEAEKREGQIKILAKEKELAELKRQGLVIGIFLLFVIATLAVTRMRSSFKKRKAIYEANQSLAAERLKNEKLIQQNLKNELQFKSQELINFGLHISQKNELYISFIKQMQELEFLNKYDAREQIRNLIQFFSRKLKFNETLDNYETDAEYLNEDFFFRLQTKFPNLTDHDKRLVAQLRRKLSSKEISSLNNISVKSVEISRYRLRKKLSLEKGQSLVDFIQTI